MQLVYEKRTGFVGAVMGDPSKNSISRLGHFVDHGDGTVTDTQTGLMWMRAVASFDRVTSALMSLQQALAFQCALAVHSDWRLPTIHGLSCVVLNSPRYELDEQVFPNQSGLRFWSSSESPSNNKNGNGVQQQIFRPVRFNRKC